MESILWVLTEEPASTADTLRWLADRAVTSDGLTRVLQHQNCPTDVIDVALDHQDRNVVDHALAHPSIDTRVVLDVIRSRPDNYPRTARTHPDPEVIETLGAHVQNNPQMVALATALAKNPNVTRRAERMIAPTITLRTTTNPSGFDGVRWLAERADLWDHIISVLKDQLKEVPAQIIHSFFASSVSLSASSYHALLDVIVSMPEHASTQRALALSILKENPVAVAVLGAATLNNSCSDDLTPVSTNHRPSDPDVVCVAERMRDTTDPDEQAQAALELVDDRNGLRHPVRTSVFRHVISSPVSNAGTVTRVLASHPEIMSSVAGSVIRRFGPEAASGDRDALMLVAAKALNRKVHGQVTNLDRALTRIETIWGPATRSDIAVALLYDDTVNDDDVINHVHWMELCQNRSDLTARLLAAANLTSDDMDVLDKVGRNFTGSFPELIDTVRAATR